ncbi:hypothetical protein HMPREF1544_07209 [Mucor circinelloides 1006PhL]|uniref:Uncharacterized protein n=1 Tax=Mucor circinelloides f. circinelloides (strain 1006PhL) TaxID=1220926 RepID=S2JC40_MUCC1|nr:hypothetical protein HMPREF1544_07209 [Mucor circinelloides 1006PhL]
MRILYGLIPLTWQYQTLEKPRDRRAFWRPWIAVVGQRKHNGIESIVDWSEADSELTSYRYCGPQDTRPGCLAAKKQMIANHSLFPFTKENALSTCSIRKIDTTVVTNIEKERIELSTNEWKKRDASADTVMEQQ